MNCIQDKILCTLLVFKERTLHHSFDMERNFEHMKQTYVNSERFSPECTINTCKQISSSNNEAYPSEDSSPHKHIINTPVKNAVAVTKQLLKRQIN